MITIYQIGWILIFGVIFLVLRAVIAAYVKYRGVRLVTCPENKEPAGVELDTLHAAFQGTPRVPHLRLKECTRWPERKDCGQMCLAQIEAAPEDCLVRNILTKWYEGKDCAYCGKPLGEIHWADHKPAMLNAEGITVEWNEIRPEKVPGVLATHRAVCWNCHMNETFRRKFPELVVDRVR